jgi:hypothetical protein
MQEGSNAGNRWMEEGRKSKGRVQDFGLNFQGLG